MAAQRIVRSLLMVLVLAVPGSAVLAACQEGKIVQCTVDGRVGISECIGGRFTPCIATELETITGRVNPNYVVLTVIYSPPGSAGGSASSVTYGEGSSTGVATSASESFKQDQSTSLSVGAGAGSFTGTGTFTFDTSLTSGSSSKLEIKKSESSSVSVPGPSSDGINHDLDQIYLWLNPTIEIQVQGNQIRWRFVEDVAPEVQFLHVGWLKNPDSIPPGVMSALQRNGVTVEDFPDILARNPIAAGEPLDNDRYEDLLLTIPYQPPFEEGGPVTSQTETLTTSRAESNTRTISSSYSVGVSVEGGAGFGDLIKAKMKNSLKWTWTNSRGVTQSESANESSSLVLRGPSFGYTGPTMMKVFFDRIYKTFLFVPFEGDQPLFAAGTLTLENGEPLAFEEVEVQIGDQWHRTFTDAVGRYQFFGEAQDVVNIRTNDHQWAIPEVSEDRNINVALPRDR